MADQEKKQTSAEDDFLTVEQAAKTAGLSSASIYEACKRRLLPHYRLSGTGRRGKILIRPADLIAFIESQRVDVGARPSASAPVSLDSQAGPFSELDPQRLSRAWKRD